MEARSATELIWLCTLKGTLYGAVSGLVTGVVFIYGTGIGLPAGAAFGALFGFVNGIVLWGIERYQVLRQDIPYDTSIRVTACAVTSFVLYAIITAVFYSLEAILAFFCLFAFPGVMISAVILGNWATDQNLTMPTE